MIDLHLIALLLPQLLLLYHLEAVTVAAVSL